MGAWRRGARLGSWMLLAFALGCGESSHDGDGTTAGTGGGSGVRGGAGGGAGQASSVGGGAGSSAGSAGSAGDGAGGAAGAQAGKGGAGGSSSGAGGMSATGGAPDQATAEYRACADYVKARCQRFEDCGSVFASTCLEQEMPLCPDWVFGPGSNNTPEHISQCAADWKTAPCSTFQTYIPVCVYAPGDFENGEACTSDSQCKSGMCAGSDTYCGTCQRVLEPSESCADPSTGMCPYGTDCDGTMCAPRRGSALPPGSACDVDYQLCQVGYTCRDDVGAEPSCQVRLAAGSACEAYQCVAHHYCEPTSHLCTPSAPAGMPCGDEGIGACDQHAFCDRSTTPPLCVARVGLGETCFDDPDITDPHGNCDGGLFCICDAGEDCTDGVCLVRAYEGEACGDATTYCVAGTECRSGKCEISGLQGTYAGVCMK